MVLGEDAQTKIDFETVNEIHFDVNNAELFNMTGNQLSGSGVSTGSFGRIDATSLPNIGYANFTGSVGIGTTSPGEKLEVIGNISSSGTITGLSASFQSADINGGTIDGITSLTSRGDLDIGSHSFRAATLQSDTLGTAGVVHALSTGILSTDGGFTYNSGTDTTFQAQVYYGGSAIGGIANMNQNNSDTNSPCSGSGSFLHSPTTASEITYDIRLALTFGSGSFGLDSGHSHMSIMEVAA